MTIPPFSPFLAGTVADPDEMNTRLESLRTGVNTSLAVLVDPNTLWVESGDTAAEIQAKISSGAPKIGFPVGTFNLPDGVGLETRPNQVIFGAGRDKTVITTKDAYAFAAPAVGAQDRVTIHDMGFSLRAGSVSGGAVKALSDSYHSAWILERLYGLGLATVTDPVFEVDGFIGSYIDLIQAQVCQVGLRVGNTGFVSNATIVTRSRFVNCSEKGVHLKGGGGNRVLNCIIEANETGYGVHVEDCASASVEDCWFEDNGKADVYLHGNSSGTRVRGNKIHYHHAGSTDPHIKVVGPAGPSAIYNVAIEGNFFADPAGATADITLDANTAGAQILFNRPSGTGTNKLVDNGKGTNVLGNYNNDAYGIPNRLGGVFEAAYDPYYDTHRPTIWGRKRTGQTSELLLLEAEDGTDLVRVSSAGRLETVGIPLRLFSKAGTIGDGDAGPGPVSGLIGWDETNKTLTVRDGAQWWRRRFSLTGQPGAVADLAGGATLAEVITTVNTILAKLREGDYIGT